MPIPLIVSSTLITLALVFYSLGVWSERISHDLRSWHVISFWIGFIFDVSGTWTMHQMANGSFNLSESHTLTGQIALWLMLFHAMWATRVVLKGNKEKRIKFHRLSFIVWLIWLIPYLSGLYIGMLR